MWRLSFSSDEVRDEVMQRETVIEGFLPAFWPRADLLWQTGGPFETNDSLSQVANAAQIHHLLCVVLVCFL